MHQITLRRRPCGESLGHNRRELVANGQCVLALSLLIQPKEYNIRAIRVASKLGYIVSSQRLPDIGSCRSLGKTIFPLRSVILY